MEKKITEKEREEWEITNLKSKIEMCKTGFDRYVEVIVRSVFIENCTGGAYFNKLYHDLMKNGFDKIRGSKKTEKEQTDLNHELLWGGPLGRESEKEILEGNLKYWKRLESWAKCELKNLNDEKKKEIIIDSLEQKDIWSEQFNRNSVIYRKLEEKPKKKVVKK